MFYFCILYDDNVVIGELNIIDIYRPCQKRIFSKWCGFNFFTSKPNNIEELLCFASLLFDMTFLHQSCCFYVEALHERGGLNAIAIWVLEMTSVVGNIYQYEEILILSIHRLCDFF